MAGPRLAKATILEKIVQALQLSGVSARRVGPESDPVRLPIALDVTFAMGLQRRYALYIWTVSHGGRSRDDGEFRIQTKIEGTDRLLFGKATTVLLGFFSQQLALRYSPSPPDLPPHAELFVAWDPVLHLHLGQRSSCQVQRDAIERAYLDGVATYQRRVVGGSEQVIAVTPERLGWYLEAACRGHNMIRA
jgi:hypothetical protein